MAQLKKDGTVKRTPNNKRQGVKSEVYKFTPEDIKKMNEYYKERGQWDHYLLFVLSLNLARRIGDMLSLRWVDFFDPSTGELRRDLLTIVEDKTDKLANPHINIACRNAIAEYINHTNCDPSANNYSGHVFEQRVCKNYFGRVMDANTFRLSMKKAAKEVGIKYNVGPHSLRKTFGFMTRMLHPKDGNSMELLRLIYNHSSTQITSRYIGLDRDQMDKYYDDMGDFYTNYIEGNESLNSVTQKPIVSLYVSDIHELINIAYRAGQESANNPVSDDLTTVSTIYELADELQV